MTQADGQITVLLSPLQAFYFVTKVSGYYFPSSDKKELEEVKRKMLGGMVEVTVGGKNNGSIRAVGFDGSFRQQISGARDRYWKPEELKYLFTRGGIREITV